MKKNTDSNISTESPVSTIRSNIDEAFKSLLLLSRNAKNAKNQDIKEMIRYYDGMTKNIEDRRIQIANFAWQSSAVVITAFGVALTLHIVALLKILLLLILATILVMSLLKIREYHVQSQSRYIFRRYPEYENNWKWFYYGNNFLARINADPFTFDKSSTEDRILYLQGLEQFTKNYSTETIDQELRSNVVQLFILQSHNFYKNRFYLRLLNYDLLTPRILLFLLVIYCEIVIIILIRNPILFNFLLTRTF